MAAVKLEEEHLLRHSRLHTKTDGPLFPAAVAIVHELARQLGNQASSQKTVLSEV
jgi:hypothetical protein